LAVVFLVCFVEVELDDELDFDELLELDNLLDNDNKTADCSFQNSALRAFFSFVFLPIFFLLLKTHTLGG